MDTRHTGQGINRIEVEGLFDQFSYTLPAKEILPNPAILYGDNGVGKSTILRLVFHLLSSAPKKGHRSALIRINFRVCRVYLSSGHVLVAIRRSNADDVELLLSIEKGKSKLAEWRFKPDGEDTPTLFDLDAFTYDPNTHRFRPSGREKGSVPQGPTAYLSVLDEISPALYYLNAERRLDSDVVADPNDEMELRRAIRLEEPKRLQDLVVRSREIALAQALTNAARWLQSLAVRSTNEGSTNVHSVYVDVVKRITSGQSEVSFPEGRVDDLLRRLRRISEDTANLSRYELTPALDTSDFYKSLRSPSTNIAVDLLTPYIKSLESRLETLQPVYQIIDRFVESINKFLVGKSISFTLGKGFEIRTPKAKLRPRELSSGEQQLILLFCYVLIARDRASVFMIDEPEISLNVKWQRKLLQALESITEGASIQFILASHSIELIAQRRSHVVRVGGAAYD